MKLKLLTLPLLIIFTFVPAIAANIGNKTEVTLKCPAQGVYLDGSSIKTTGDEKIYISYSQMNAGEKNGKPQFYTITEAKIASNDTKFDANLIAHSADYVIVSYGTLLKEGIGGHLISANYMIDLKTKKMRRTLSLFPDGKDFSFEGDCE